MDIDRTVESDTAALVEPEQPEQPITAPVEMEASRRRFGDMRAGADVCGIIPRTIDDVFRIAQAICIAGLAPDSYTKGARADDDESNSRSELPKDQIISRVVIGIMKGAEVGLPPITALSTIAIINGRPCIWGDGVVALLQGKGHLEKMRIEEIGTKPEGAIDTGKFTDDFGVRVTMWRKGQDEPYVGEFTVGDAKRAKLWMNFKRKPWIQHPRRMLKWRAFSYPARDGFADDLMGLSIREEVEDLLPVAPKIDASFLDDAPAKQLPSPNKEPMRASVPQERETAAAQPDPGVRQDRPQEPKDPIIAPGGATYPKLAAAVDPERKPSEGHHSDPADEAGGACGEEDGQRRANAVEPGGSPATTEDYWSRQDLILDPPLRPGTAAIDLPRLRDELCNIIAAAPSEARLDAFLKHNRPNLNRLIGFKDPKTQTAGVADVQAAVGARRKVLGAAL